MKKLTDYQAGQLLHIHFAGDFKYKSDNGTRVAPTQWRKMIDTLLAQGYIEYGRGVKLTAKGREYVDANHLTIATLH